MNPTFMQHPARDPPGASVVSRRKRPGRPRRRASGRRVCTGPIRRSVRLAAALLRSPPAALPSLRPRRREYGGTCDYARRPSRIESWRGRLTTSSGGALEDDNRDLARGLLLIFLEEWHLRRLLVEQALALRAGSDGGLGLETFGANLEGGSRMGQEIVVPGRIFRRARLGSDNHDPVAIARVDQRVRVSLAAPGAGSDKQQHRSAGELAADLAGIRSELLDHFEIEFVHVHDVFLRSDEACAPTEHSPAVGEVRNRISEPRRSLPPSRSCAIARAIEAARR